MTFKLTTVVGNQPLKYRLCILYVVAVVVKLMWVERQVQLVQEWQADPSSQALLGLILEASQMVASPHHIQVEAVFVVGRYSLGGSTWSVAGFCVSRLHGSSDQLLSWRISCTGDTCMTCPQELQA